MSVLELLLDPRTVAVTNALVISWLIVEQRRVFRVVWKMRDLLIKNKIWTID